MEVCCENPADHVFVDVDAECQGDLLGNSLAAPSAIAPFHFKDRVDQFFRRAFGTWPTDSFGGKQHSVLLLDQHFMKMQQSRGF
jgi:hypothetical protein